MGIFTKDIKTMDDLFLHQLEDIYYAEQQLTKAIPKMADMATNADLKAGLKSHVIDTKKTRSNVSIRCLRSSKSSPRAPTARRSTDLSRKPTIPLERSRTRPSWTPLLSLIRRPSNTTRWHVMARLSPGLRNWVMMTSSVS